MDVRKRSELDKATTVAYSPDFNLMDRYVFKNFETHSGKMFPTVLGAHAAQRVIYVLEAVSESDGN